MSQQIIDEIKTWFLNIYENPNISQNDFLKVKEINTKLKKKYGAEVSRLFIHFVNEIENIRNESDLEEKFKPLILAIRKADMSSTMSTIGNSLQERSDDLKKGCPNSIKCEECGGRVIQERDGEFVCKECGIVYN